MLGFIGLLPLIIFFVMIPIAHIAVRILCDTKSVYDVHFYSKPLNLFIALLASVLMVYFLGMLASN